MNLIDYHRLRNEEQKNADLSAIEQAAREQDATFPERVDEILGVAIHRFSDDLRTVVRGPQFESLTALGRLYLACSPEQRIYVRSRLWYRSGPGAEATSRRTIANRLESFGLRAAVIALRERSLEMVRIALAAFAIADLGADVRETLMSLTVPFHVTKSLGADAASLFRQMAALSGPAFSAVLIDFANRPESLQTLGSMGWHEVETPDGPGFEWGRPSPVRPPGA